MPNIKDNTLVIRGGKVTAGSLQNLAGGGDITTGDIVVSLSVQLSPDAGSITDRTLIRQLVAALPNNVFTVVYAKQLLRVKKAALAFDPLPNNNYHGLITGNSVVKDIEDVFVHQSSVYTRQQLGL
ncbi:MAG TPA: hypothetical protein VFN30_00900 [Chitinophagaceae bacterium]|nr:hypothetical protein [Chitinophagaceae bacterium]